VRGTRAEEGSIGIGNVVENWKFFLGYGVAAVGHKSDGVWGSMRVTDTQAYEVVGQCTDTYQLCMCSAASYCHFINLPHGQSQSLSKCKHLTVCFTKCLHPAT